MNYYFDDDIIVHIPSVYNTGERAKRTETTSYHSLFKRKMKDVEGKMGVLKTGAASITPGGIIYDLMAGVGFSASIYQKYMTPSHLILNDLNPECGDILKVNYPNAEVTQEDAEKLKIENAELVFIDFNSFTWRHLDRWKDLLRTCCNNTNNLWVTDTVIFSYKFGASRTAYDCVTIEAYYEMMAQFFRKEYMMNLDRVGTWRNAGVLMFSKMKKSGTPSPVEIMKYKPVPIHAYRPLNFKGVI